MCFVQLFEDWCSQTNFISCIAFERKIYSSVKIHRISLIMRSLAGKGNRYHPDVAPLEPGKSRGWHSSWDHIILFFWYSSYLYVPPCLLRLHPYSNALASISIFTPTCTCTPSPSPTPLISIPFPRLVFLQYPLPLSLPLLVPILLPLPVPPPLPRSLLYAYVFRTLSLPVFRPLLPLPLPLFLHLCYYFQM